jgi:hypothetical protein
MPLVQSIFNKTMLEMGQEVSNHCEYDCVGSKFNSLT